MKNLILYNGGMEELQDYDLVMQVAAGDDQAFLQLYEQYVDPLHDFVLRILQDPMLAEEVIQDTFLKLWNRAGQYITDRGSVQAWLLAIARHSALDCLRREARHPLLPANNQSSEGPWQDIPDASSLTDETRWRSLHFAVQSLSGEQRRVIDLAYFQGLSQSEISETLGWPLGTVKTRLRSAMEQLRLAWAEE